MLRRTPSGKLRKEPIKKPDHLSEAEQRTVLTEIARDDATHARDRIAAIRALMALERQGGREVGELDNELNRILSK